MQFIKIFFLSFAYVWKTVVQKMTKDQAAYEMIMKMIPDKTFTDIIVRKEFQKFVRINRAKWRIKRLLDTIAEHRPELLKLLDMICATES